MSVFAQTYPPHGPTIAPIRSNDSAGVAYPTPKSRHEQSQWNMELAGHSDLQGRLAYPPIIISQDGHFIAYVDGDPAITSACTKVILTNNVEIDDRGLIYSADRAGTGLHIMRLTGDAAAVADKPGTN
jgi:hypothetical protein